MHVFPRKPGREQTPFHSPRRRGVVSLAVRGVDLDQLLEDLSGQLLMAGKPSDRVTFGLAVALTGDWRRAERQD